MTVIWCIVPEIWSAVDKIFCHFWLFFALTTRNNPKNQNFEKLKEMPRDIIILHMCTINDNHMMYSSYNMKCDRQNFLSFSTVFCLFTPLTTQKIKILKKMKKKSGDIIILHMCTINDNHMMYGSWDMKHDRQNVLSFLTVFCNFTPPSLKTQKIKILKNWKKNLKILSFYTGASWMTIKQCMAPEILSMTDKFFCHFGLLFALLPP